MEGDGEVQAGSRQAQCGDGLQQPRQRAPTELNGQRRRARVVGGDGVVYGLTNLLLAHCACWNGQPFLDEWY